MHNYAIVLHVTVVFIIYEQIFSITLTIFPLFLINYNNKKKRGNPPSP